MGLQCCQMIKEQAGKYPEGIIETQTLLIKKFLQIKDLNSPYRGNKNIFMIIQYRWTQFLRCGSSPASLLKF